MKIIDGLKLEGRPADIPNCSRDDLPAFFKEQGFKAGVEVGVYLGDYTKVLAQSGLQIYGVDPWRLTRDYGNPRGQRRLDDQYKIASDKLAPYPNVTLLRKTSMEAVEDFPNESLDFVYIDANHLFRHVADDIYEWARKIKQGGVICGHDYARYVARSTYGGCHAQEIVDAYVRAYNIPNFWVLGNRKVVAGEIRDHYRSWMIIKNHLTP